MRSWLGGGGEILEQQKYRKIFWRVQRFLVLRVVSVYRTVSAAALEVVTEIIYIDLLVAER